VFYFSFISPCATGLNVKDQGHSERKCNNYCFFCAYLRQKWIYLRRTKNQNGQRPVLHVADTFHRRKCFVFVIICNPLLSGKAACRSSHLAVYVLVRKWFTFLTSRSCLNSSTYLQTSTERARCLNYWNVQVTRHNKEDADDMARET